MNHDDVHVVTEVVIKLELKREFLRDICYKFIDLILVAIRVLSI